MPRRKGFFAWELERALRLRLGFVWMERRAGHSRWQTASAELWKVLEPGTEALGPWPCPLSGFIGHWHQLLL